MASGASQSPQTGQFNSYPDLSDNEKVKWGKVSIPSNGSIQFLQSATVACLVGGQKVSIPSNGSIQFLPYKKLINLFYEAHFSLNPLKRVNSILTRLGYYYCIVPVGTVSIPSNGSIQFLHNQFRVAIPFFKSQSPQTGQFNSYGDVFK